MPIEIKELHIKINIDESQGNSDVRSNEQNEKNKIIATCVEQVLEILAKNEER